MWRAGVSIQGSCRQAALTRVEKPAHSLVPVTPNAPWPAGLQYQLPSWRFIFYVEIQFVVFKINTINLREDYENCEVRLTK